PNQDRVCTPLSVAAHALYEQANPYLIKESEGTLDLSKCRYEAYGERAVKVSGSRFIPARKPTVKLEGVTLAGYRTICIAGIRDPQAIKQLKEILEGVRSHVAETFRGRLSSSDYYHLNFRIYGLNAVEGEIEPVKQPSHELGIIIDVVASSQELANSICALARSTMLHYDYEGRKATGGNLAFPYSPSDIPMGPTYQFNVYHKVEVEGAAELLEMFKIEVLEVGV
ncbi:MAG: acyclic terpene utilization AtuA family protein, partial [Candidatus Hecatellaceae archaeon]